MPKSISVTTAIEKAKLASENALLVALDVKVKQPNSDVVIEELHLVRNSEDIDYQGVTYKAFPFEIDIKIEAGGVPVVTMSGTDMTKTLHRRMQDYGGMVGSEVKFFVINTGAMDREPDVVEDFLVTSGSAKNFSVTFQLGAENALATPFPRRRQLRDRCAWKYKSAECGYIGTLPSCDLTLQGDNGCKVHENTLNFGGFPGIRSDAIRYG